jgi:hypothetical protein
MRLAAARVGGWPPHLGYRICALFSICVYVRSGGSCPDVFICPNGDAFNASTGNCQRQQTPTVSYGCGLGGTLSSYIPGGRAPNCSTVTPKSFTCPSGGNLTNSMMCSANYSVCNSNCCPIGTTNTGSNCVNTTTATKSCPSGYTDVGTSCQKCTSMGCASGLYDSTSSTCYKSKYIGSGSVTCGTGVCASYPISYSGGCYASTAPASCLTTSSASYTYTCQGSGAICGGGTSCCSISSYTQCNAPCCKAPFTFDSGTDCSYSASLGECPAGAVDLTIACSFTYTANGTLVRVMMAATLIFFEL